MYLFCFYIFANLEFGGFKVREFPVPLMRLLKPQNSQTYKPQRVHNILLGVGMSPWKDIYLLGRENIFSLVIVP